MSSLNKAQLIGNMCQPPELKETHTGVPVLSFSLATNKTYMDKSGEKQKRTEYHNCIAWRGLAEVIAKYVGKGDKLYVEGELQTRSWDDPNGGKKFKTEIIVSEMQMLSPKKDGKPYQEETHRPKQETYSHDQGDIDIDSVPF